MKRKLLLMIGIAALLSGCAEEYTDGPPVTTAQPAAVTEASSQAETTATEQTTAELTTTAAAEITEVQTTTASAAPPAAKAPKVKAPGAVSFMVSTSEKQTEISWDSVKGADGYAVWIKRSEGGKWERQLETDELSCVLDEPRSKANSFCVKAYRLDDSGGKVFSEKAHVSSFPYLYQKDGVTYVDGMLLVNKTYPLPADYGNGLTEQTLAAFYEMQQAAANDGISLWITSGFRSYSEQQWLYQSYVYRDGSSESADKYSARAGHSEHQSGLAFDLNFAGTAFNGTPEAVWIAENCCKFGFIIRYPEGKEDKTGYNYESWHCRYVGKERAKALTESGLTVEEFYGLTSEYS